MRFIVTCVLFLLLGGAGTAGAAGAAPAEQARLAKLKGIFDLKLAEYDAAYKTQLSQWPKSYVAALDTLKLQMQRGGNLEGWTAVKEEQRRFAANPEIPMETIEKSPAAVQNVQTIFVKQREAARIEHYKRILALRDLYVQNLEAAKRNWTQAGNFEAALAAKQAIESAGEVPAVAEATFGLADRAVSEAGDADGTSAGDESQPNADETGGIADENDGAESASLPEGVTELEGVTVYKGVRPPSSGDGYVYKRQSLSRTENSPLAAGVSVACWEGDRKNRSSSSSYYKATQEEHFIRVELYRPRGDPMQNVEVTVKHYVRDMSSQSSRSRIRPTLFASLPLTLPDVGEDHLVLDYPGIGVSSSSYRSSSYYSSYSFSSGSKYYGFILTVRHEGQIIYQGTSVAQLRTEAPSH